MDFDLLVIGSGPAGEKAATQAAYYGHRVAVIERSPEPGGKAVSEAGIPTKTLRETALYLTGFRQREIYGLGLALGEELKLHRLRERTREVVALMVEASRTNLARMHVELIPGTARLVPGGVEVDGRRLTAHRVLIATGSRPHHPPGIPFDDPAVFDSERILQLDRLPRRLVVCGGGAVGCEYASIFTALGANVTLLEATDRLLRFADEEIARLLADTFRRLGTDVRIGVTLDGVRRDGDVLRVALGDGSTQVCDALLFAGGRLGNTEDLGLETVGVQVDARGRIVVDDHYETTAPGIYAAGDVIGPPALASVSMEQGRVAACHAFGIPFKQTVDPEPPLGVYSIPEIAMVGLTEDVARARGLDVEVGRGWFDKNARARIAGTPEGLVKLVFRRDDRTLLGVHILGDIASELIHLGQVMLHDRHTIDAFIHMTFNVPTYSLAYKYAAYDGLSKRR